MRADDILNAMTYIDEDLIKATEKIRAKKPSLPVYRTIAIAASLCVCIGCVCAAAYFGTLKNAPDNSGGGQFAGVCTEAAADKTDGVQNEGLPPVDGIVPEAPEGGDTEKELPEVCLCVERVFENGINASVEDGLTSFFDEGRALTVIFDNGIYLSVPVSDGKWKNEYVTFNEELFSVGDTFTLLFHSFEEAEDGTYIIYADSVILPMEEKQ